MSIDYEAGRVFAKVKFLHGGCGGHGFVFRRMYRPHLNKTMFEAAKHASP